MIRLTFLTMYKMVMRIGISPFPQTLELVNLYIALIVKAARATVGRAWQGNNVAMLICMLYMSIELVKEV
jgi:hypothetical protein